MQIALLEIKATHPIILSITQTKFKCLTIVLPVTTQKLTKEQVKQSQTEYTMNLLIFSLVLSALKVHLLYKKEGCYLHQAPPRRVAYALHKSLKEELKQLQKQKIPVLLGIDEMT